MLKYKWELASDLEGNYVLKAKANGREAVIMLRGIMQISVDALLQRVRDGENYLTTGTERRSDRTRA
jgi:hypothetical protein